MASSQAPLSESPSSEPSGDGARVLVIDDSQTILKVVETILGRNGYRVEVARDGVEGYQRIEDEGPFDLVLLDFVMPRMNGYQFCRKLRAHEEHKTIPVVLMSARTAAIGDRFVEQTGAADALDKPFDARALIAVVQVVLSKKATQSKPRSMPSPDMMMDEDELDPTAEEAPPPSRHVRSLNQVGSTIASAVAPKLTQLSASELSQRQVVERTVAEAVDESVVAAIGESLDDVDTSAHSTEMLRGRLAKMPLAEVLQLLQLRRQTGVIYVTHGRMSMTLCIEDGVLQLAQSENTDDEFRIGRYFVEAGWLTREQVDAELEAYEGTGKLFGEWLVEKELINENQLFHALAKQSAELAYEVLRWPEGRFVLTEDPFTEEAEKAMLSLGISELVLEGFRRVDEWRHMAGTIDFEAVLVVDQVALGTLDDSKIGQSERPVLEAIDGKRSAREVMEISEVASFDAIQAIYRFLQSRIVREVKPGRKSTHSSLHAIDSATAESTEAAAGEQPAGEGKGGEGKGEDEGGEDKRSEDAAHAEP